MEECLDPIPTYTTDMRTNDELVVWNVERMDCRKLGNVNGIAIIKEDLRMKKRMKNCYK